ncbi:MAG TPA: hypothetical protein VFW98_18825 [Gemmatimonadaceae bacterium]|nr:hypothetical protein [Gemmatimonadaceae bacterium]
MWTSSCKTIAVGARRNIRAMGWRINRITGTAAAHGAVVLFAVLFMAERRTSPVTLSIERHMERPTRNSAGSSQQDHRS